jgi:hypothetical protein
VGTNGLASAFTGEVWGSVEGLFLKPLWRFHGQQLFYQPCTILGGVRVKSNARYVAPEGIVGYQRNSNHIISFLKAKIVHCSGLLKTDFS